MAKQIKCNVGVQILMNGEWVEQEIETTHDLEKAQRIKHTEKVKFTFEEI